MGESVTLRALILPEILLQIFEHLGVRTLAIIIKVNKQWFTLGTDVLWREPELQNLVNLSDDRRQLYASKVRKLSFNGDDSDLHSKFRTLQFRSLKKVSLDTYRASEGSPYHIFQYIQPSLEELLIYGGDLDDDLLDHIRGTCRRMRMLLIDSPGNITPEAFFNFVCGCKSVETMIFLYGMDHLLTDELIWHLARRENLLELGIGKLCSTTLLEEISISVTEPFSHLQSLQIPISSSSAPWLASELNHITALDVSIRDLEMPVFPSILSMKNLSSLSLRFAVSLELSFDDILSLTALTKLGKLFIGADGMYHQAAATAFAQGCLDSEFDEFCAKLPLLRQLEFNVQCNLTGAAMRSLSKSCPLLQECAMRHVFNVHDLGLDDQAIVMFPNLECLHLGDLRLAIAENEVISRQSAVQNTAQLLRHHCPKLTDFDLGGGDEASEALCAAFASVSSS